MLKQFCLFPRNIPSPVSLNAGGAKRTEDRIFAYSPMPPGRVCLLPLLISLSLSHTHTPPPRQHPVDPCAFVVQIVRVGSRTPFVLGESAQLSLIAVFNEGWWRLMLTPDSVKG